MKNKIYYVLYGVASLVVILLAYNFYGQSKRAVLDKTIKSLDKSMIKMYQEQFDINKSFGYIWGIKEKKIKNDINKTVILKNTNSTLTSIFQKGNKICIAKNCYRFLGIYYKGKTPYVSFYSKKFKKGLQDFSINQILDKTLYVKELKHNKLFLKDKNSSREWSFQLFDVNITKYKPKENNETNF